MEKTIETEITENSRFTSNKKSKKVNICMLAYTFYETDNRVRRYAETCAKRGDHVDAIVLGREEQPSYDTLNGVNIYRIQNRKINESGKFSYLLKLIKFLINSSIFLTKKHYKDPYDLIHIHNVPDFLVFASWVLKLTGSSIILDIHDILPEFYASKFNTSHKSPVFRMLTIIERLSAVFANHVIISNDIWKKTLISRSIPKEKCTVLVNYPDPNIFYNRPKNRKDGKVIMSYPGTLSKHQGLDIAIKAFDNIKDEVPEAEFHIYGEGTAKQSLINLTSQLNLNEKVIFNDLVSLEKIAEMMANVDIGIIPKRNDAFGGEAFSTKILEFMAVGIPVIVSSTKIDKYYFNESLVKFFRPDDDEDLARCMLTLIQNEDIRENLVINGFKYIETNNWQVKKHIYLDLVDSITRSY